MTTHVPAGSRRRVFTWATVATLAVTLGLLAGCGAAEDKPVAAKQGDANTLAAFEEKVDQIVADKSAEQTGTPPTEGPKAAADKKVYVVACWQALEGCQRESETAVEAGEAIGWDMKLIDTESKPDKMISAVQTAINDDVDGIVVQAIDMATLAGPIQEAKDAGIKVVCFACVNQDDLADQVIPSSESFYDDGYAMGAAIYDQTDGKPRILIVSNKEVGVIANRQKGTEDFVKDCVAAGGDCEIVSTEYFLFADLTTRVPGLVTGSLRQHPDTNALWMAFDSTSSFMAQGVAQAGLPADQVGLYGFDGNIPNMAAIRDGKQAASLAGPFEWVGWAEIDGLNRLFQGEAPVDDVIVSKLLTADNIPDDDIYDGDVEFRQYYKDVWGVS